MPDSPNSSFIPKRGPTPSRRGSPSKRLYLFTFVSYMLLFASLVAAGGMYLYNVYLDRQFANEVKLLSEEMQSFSVANMQKVLEFDSRLKQASSRFDNSVSVAAIFRAIESVTIDTVMLKSLDLTRSADEKYLLSASVQTDSFDSTIFQRDTYQQNQSISAVEILNVQASVDSSSEESSAQSVFSFSAEIEVPVSAVLYQAGADQIFPPTTVSTPEAGLQEVVPEPDTEEPIINDEII